MRRLGLLGLLGALACTPPPPRPPTPPAAPVLEGDTTPSVSLSGRWTLRGTAPEGTLVRLYLDDACRGPAWRDVTPLELSTGFEVDLASGTVNVFTAEAVDGQGVASECSSPVRVRYERPRPPQRPDVRSIPQVPTRETHFVLIGNAVDAVTVRLFEGTACAADPLATLSAEDYARVGFGVDVAEDGTSRLFALDALNVIGERSPCTPWLMLWSDHMPPQVEAQLRSPTPSPEHQAFIAVSTDASEGTVFLGPGCAGRVLRTCAGAGCLAVQVDFPEAPSQTWSVSAVDGLGNRSACVDSSEQWLFDPDAGVPVVELLPGARLRGRVPVSNLWVQLFDGAGCVDGTQRAQLEGSWLAGGLYLYNYFGEPDGGLVSARGTDGVTIFPCSAPVLRE